MKKTASKKGMGASGAVAVGVTVAAMSAAAYLLFGPEGKKNRKIIRGWSVKMKGEIIEKFEKAKDLTEPVYHSIVDQVSAKYAKMKDIDADELAQTIADIRKHWKSVSKDGKKAVKKVVKKVKSASK